jgi:hypothetical protein
MSAGVYACDCLCDDDVVTHTHTNAYMHAYRVKVKAPKTGEKTSTNPQAKQELWKNMMLRILTTWRCVLAHNYLCVCVCVELDAKNHDETWICVYVHSFSTIKTNIHLNHFPLDLIHSIKKGYLRFRRHTVIMLDY